MRILLLLPLLLLLGNVATAQEERLFLGNSITEAEGYVDILAEELPYETIGRAACGATTTWQWTLDGPAPGLHCALEFEASLYELFVDPWVPLSIVYALLGTNDSAFHAWLWDDIPIHPDEYAANLRALVEALQRDAATVVVLIAPPDVFADAPERNARLAEYRERIRQLCGEMFGVVCGPDLSRILTEPEDFDDSLHPSAQGHAKIAAALLDCDAPGWSERMARATAEFDGRCWIGLDPSFYAPADGGWNAPEAGRP